ncbi:EAL domain-containing protein [Flocculibacter collagenilyticus]|uniref:EAL domain-containing protein n=1 Tax=Flocculibacter collagenilyticus TaxID=2744479 RepID=UPI0018F7BFB2|nr:EAL domain-containing protein [Flocculibacter collagenilyticus]
MRYLFGIVLFCVVLNIHAKETVKLEQLSLDEGLSQGEVQSMLQDHEGFLWLGTQQGLNLFDGYRIQLVSGPENILQIQSISSLYQDNKNRIWVGSTPNRNFIIDKQTGEIEEIDPPFPTDYDIWDSSFGDIKPAKGDDLWLATLTAIFYYNATQHSVEFFTEFQSILNDNNIIRKIIQIDDYLFVATSNGLYRVSIATKEVVHIDYLSLLTKDKAPPSEDSLNVKGFYLSDNRTLLLGTVAGLYQVAIEQLLTNVNSQSTTPSISILAKELVPELNIWKLIEESEHYWLATNDGLYKLHKNQELEHIVRLSETVYQIADDDIQSMIKDKEGNIWLASRNDGVFKLKPDEGHFTFYYQSGIPNYSLSENTVWASREDQHGNYWVGTDNGLNHINTRTGKITQLLVNPNKKERFSNSTVIDLEIQGNTVWAITGGGIKRFNTETLQEELLLIPENAKDVFQEVANDLEFVDEHTMLILNDGNILFFDTNTGKITTKESDTPSEKITDMLVKTVGRDHNDENTILVSMVDKVIKYDLQTGARSSLHELPPSDKPRTTATDTVNDGTKTWIAYSGFGVYVIDNKTGKELNHITSLNGLPDNSIHQLFVDDNGYIWATSNTGLIRINPSSYQVRTYGTKDGLMTSEFNGGASTKTKNGTLLLGSIKGLVKVSPSDLLKSNTDSNLKTNITNISLLSRDLGPSFGGQGGQTIEIRHDDYGLKLQFSALSYSYPKKMKYKYWLEGDTETPPTVVSTSELFLPKLSPGNTTFNVSVIDYETGKESPPTKLFLVVHPSPFLSWWALLIYFTIASIAIFLVYRQKRKRQIELIKAHKVLKRSEERLQLALSGSDSGLWDWQANENLMFEPRVSSQSKQEQVPFNYKLSFIHPEDQALFLQNWNTFISGESDVFDLTYRMKGEHDNWVWYRDLARVSQEGSAGDAQRVTGTYTDITEVKDDKDKVALFSEAFQSTRDVVIITNKILNVIAANNAFFVTTGFTHDQIINQSPTFIHSTEGKTNFLAHITGALHDKGHWEGEGVLVRRHRLSLPVLINATSFTDERNNTQYVFAITDISEQKIAEQKLKRLANYDPLTGLPNRALMLDRVAHAITHAIRTNSKFAVFFLDLDRFKQINDTLGHDVGDELLINVSRMLSAAVRRDDTVARLGGDEFVLVLEEVKEPGAISRVAQQIIDEMAKLRMISQHPISVSPSIGIAIYPDDGDNINELLKHADVAMYHAKTEGRNNFQFFETAMNTNAHKKLALENEVRDAIERDEFSLMYQPQVDMKTGKIKGFEALARWIKADGTLVSPVDFIPVTEELGLIIPLTEQLIHKALTELKKWQKLAPSCTVSINLSAKHLQNYDLIGFISNALKQHQVEPQAIEFELTESVLMDDIDAAMSVCHRLNEMNIDISLDDFGTGYSSLKYLHQLPVQKLKIDRSFVWQIGDSQSNAIIDSIVSLSKTLGIETVAEGIENKQHLAYLIELECNYAQGFYFSRPLSTEQALAVLSEEFSLDTSGTADTCEV